MKHKWHHGIEKSSCIICSRTLFTRTARKCPGDCPGPAVENVMICLSLVDRETKPKIVQAWTPEQRYAAMNWAARVHLAASDKRVRVPPMPAFIGRTL